MKMFKYLPCATLFKNDFPQFLGSKSLKFSCSVRSPRSGDFTPISLGTDRVSVVLSIVSVADLIIVAIVVVVSDTVEGAGALVVDFELFIVKGSIWEAYFDNSQQTKFDPKAEQLSFRLLKSS